MLVERLAEGAALHALREAVDAGADLRLAVEDGGVGLEAQDAGFAVLAELDLELVARDGERAPLAGHTGAELLEVHCLLPGSGLPGGVLDVAGADFSRS